MAAQSLYRRYRPRRFSELRGQEHVVRALRDSIANGREGQAYLFSGPRGTGKTSTARIMAKALNCENVEGGEPCGTCDSCAAIDNGTSYDVHELDAASNNGVDAIRDLIEKASLGTPGRHKVYILDEVHMLSANAEAALLKTLEEPPPHVVFVLATTDPQKMSDTIRSRTQHLQFHLLPADELEEHIHWVAQDAGYDLPEAAFEAALERGGGSARDTLSALELIASTGGTVGEVTDVDGLLDALIEGDVAAALTHMATGISQGLDPRGMVEDLVRHLRNGFLALVAPNVVMMSPDKLESLTIKARALGAARLVQAIERLGGTLSDLRNAPDPRVLIEVALVHLTSRSDAAASTPTAQVTAPSGGGAEIAALSARLERLEQQLATGAPRSSVPDTGGTAGAPQDQARTPQENAEKASPAPIDSTTGRKVLGGAAQRARAAQEAAEPAPPQVEDRSEKVSPETVSPETVQPPGVEAGVQPSDTDRSDPSHHHGSQGQSGVAATGVSSTPVDSTPVDHGDARSEESGETAYAAAGAGAPSSAQPTASALAHQRSVAEVWPEVRSSLRPLARAVYSAGEMTEPSPGWAVLVVTTDTQAKRCLDHRGEVASALTAAIGAPVSVDVVTGTDHAPRSGGAPSPTGSPTPTPAHDDPPNSPTTGQATSTSGSHGSAADTPTAHSEDVVPPSLDVGERPTVPTPTPGTSPGAGSAGVESPVGEASNSFADRAAGAAASTHRPSSTPSESTSVPRSSVGNAAASPDVAPPIDDHFEPGSEPEFEDEASIDLDDLEDAPPESYKGPAERLAEAFPGLEQIEEDS